MWELFIDFPGNDLSVRFRIGCRSDFRECCRFADRMRMDLRSV